MNKYQQFKNKTKIQNSKNKTKNLRQISYKNIKDIYN